MKSYVCYVINQKIRIKGPEQVRNYYKHLIAQIIRV